MPENVTDLAAYRESRGLNKPPAKKPEAEKKSSKSEEIESVFGPVVAKAYEQALREANGDATKITQILHRMQALVKDDPENRIDDDMLDLVGNLLRAK